MEQSETETAGRLLRAAPVLAALPFLLFYIHATPLNHDCGLLLQEAELVLMGDLPYIDFVDVNPPLTQYLHVAPVWLSKLLGIGVPLGFRYCVLILAFLSYFLFVRVLKISDPHPGSSYVWVLSTQWIFLNLIVFEHFGQREHLFVLGFVPWLYCRTARYGGTPPSLALAMACGLIFAPFVLLKPYFCVIVICAESFLLLRTRKTAALLSPEVYIPFAASVFYALYFLLMGQDMRDALLHRWIPFLREHYSVYNEDLVSLVLQGAPIVPISLFVVFSVVLAARAAPRRGGHQRLQFEVLAVASLVGFCMYLVQSTGWAYQAIPAFAPSLLILATLAGGRPPVSETGPQGRGARLSPAIPRTYILVLALLVFGGSLSSHVQSQPKFEKVWNWVSVLQELSAPGERIAYISSDVVPGYPALNHAGRLPAIGYLCSFPIPMFYHGAAAAGDGQFPYHNAETQSEDERLFLKEIGENILQHKPALVVEPIDQSQACPRGFRIGEYLSVTGWNGKYLKDYTLLRSFDGHNLYTRNP